MFGMSVRSNGASVRPETDITLPTHEELIGRVNVLAGQVARLTRELAEIRGTAPRAVQASTAPAHVSTVGPVADISDPKASGRSLMRLIAQITGRNEDGVRGALTNSKRFATLRAKVPNLTTNVPIMRWLATVPAGSDTCRFALVMAGHTVEELAGKGA